MEKKLIEIETQKILDGYLECLFWADQDELGDNKGIEDLNPQDLEKIKKDIKDFYLMSYKILIRVVSRDIYFKWEHVGHNFWLTRNGHGTGFWDRGLGDDGESLTKICEKFGPVWSYIGNDGKIGVS